MIQLDGITDSMDMLLLLLLLLSRFSCVRLCDPIHSSPPGSTIPGILQARTLEWVAIAFSAMDKSLYKLWELVMNMMPGLLQSMAQSIGLQRVGHD